jgi:hypothetical protein
MARTPFCSQVLFLCHSEPFEFAQDGLREESCSDPSLHPVLRAPVLPIGVSSVVKQFVSCSVFNDSLEMRRIDFFQRNVGRVDDPIALNIRRG